MRQRPRPLAAAGLVIDPVEHARVAQRAVGDLEAMGQFRGAETVEGGDQRLPVRTQTAGAVRHHVVDAGQRPIGRNEGLGSLAAPTPRAWTDAVTPAS